MSILGVGLLGGSVAMAARRVLTDCGIIGYGHRHQTLQAALRAGVVDEAYGDPVRAVRDADLVILCTPVGYFTSLLTDIAPALSPGAIVTDVGSTKRSVVEAGESILPSNVHFVGSHPIAGSEKRGLQHARADLFENALCILTPTERTSVLALESVDEFWKALGMRTSRLAPDLHDHRLAEVSHLPHALAAAILMSADPASLEFAGRGLADATRIAAGDPGLWRDILQDNRAAVRDSLRKLTDQLANFSKLLEVDQSEALFAWLAEAARKRESLQSPPGPTGIL